MVTVWRDRRTTDAGGAACYYVVQVSTAPTAPGRRITNHLAVSAPILARIGSDSLKMSAATSDELYFFTDKPNCEGKIKWYVPGCPHAGCEQSTRQAAVQVCNVQRAMANYINHVAKNNVQQHQCMLPIIMLLLLKSNNNNKH